MNQNNIENKQQIFRKKNQIFQIMESLHMLKEEYEKTEIESILTNLENDLVGLKPVKKRIREIAALLLIDRLRKNFHQNTGIFFLR